MIPTSKQRLAGKHGGATVDEVYRAVVEKRKREIQQ